jgi:AcrR family transcriptional regulator
MSRPKTISDEKLLTIARKCFFEQGPSVPTRVIALKAGISQPALFKRFKSKEELFMAAVASPTVLKRVQDLNGWIDTHPTGGDLAPQINELLLKLWYLLKDILPRLIAMHAHGNYRFSDDLFKGIKKPPAVKMVENISDFIKRGQKNGQIDKFLNPEIAAMNIVGALQERLLFKQIFKFKLAGNNLSDENYIKQTAFILYRGLSSKTEQKDD